MTKEIKVQVLQSLNDLIARVQADDVTGVALFACEPNDGQKRVTMIFGGTKDDLFVSAFERAKLFLLIENDPSEDKA